VLRAAGIRATGTLVVVSDVPRAILHGAVTYACAMFAMTTHDRGRLGRFVFDSVANHEASHAERLVLFMPPLEDGTTLAHHYPDVPGGVLDLASVPHASTDDHRPRVITAASRAGLSAAKRDPPRPRSRPARPRPATGTGCCHRRSR